MRDDEKSIMLRPLDMLSASPIDSRVELLRRRSAKLRGMMVILFMAQLYLYSGNMNAF